MDARSLPLIRTLPLVGGDAPKIVLEVDLSLGLLTRRPTGPVSALRAHNTPTLAATIEGLRLAAGDPDVAAVALLGSSSLPAAWCDELGEALDALDRAGTPTYAFAESYGELTGGTVPYGLACRCRELWLQPTGQVAITGVVGQITLLRGALEKASIEPQFAQRKEYKTAADQVAAREITPANREMTERLMRSAEQSILARVAERRGLTGEAAAELRDRAPLDAPAARAAGLVDRIGYRDQFYARLRECHGSDLRLLFAHRYEAHRRSERMRSPAAQVARRRAAKVAVVAIDGPIVSGRSQGGVGGRSCGSDTVAAALRSARENDDVAAVLLTIDSPGGSAVGSDAIRREVIALREAHLPVVASMGPLAASGGYFAAMGADHVVAAPTTLTGSIGVVAGKLVVAGLTERIGLVHESIADGAQATMFSGSEPFTDAQRALLDRWLDDVYEDFTAKAAGDRGMGREQLEAVARGRVWTGADAVGHGLVDELGGRERAIAEICRRLGRQRDGVELVNWPPVGLLHRLKPAESTHAPVAAHVGVAVDGPEQWLMRIGTALGVPLAGGVLTMPVDVRLR